MLELKEDIDTFKASGKPVIAVGDITARATTCSPPRPIIFFCILRGRLKFLVLPSTGIVRQLLENVYLTMNVFRVGENKSAVEPFLRDDMSELERQVVAQWLGDVWGAYTWLVEQPREFAPALWINLSGIPDRLDIAGGDPARLMLEAGFVDELLTHSQQDERLKDWVGATDEADHWRAVSVDDYLAARNAELETEVAKPLGGGYSYRG